MIENIKPKEIDMYELWYQTYPFEQYRAIMQAIAEQNMRLDDNNRVENLEEAIYTLERLKEKEIEHDKKNTKTPEEAIVDMGKAFGNVATEWSCNEEDSESIYLLKGFLEHGFNYLARDRDDCLWVYGIAPKKRADVWATCYEDKTEEINKYSFPEAKWTDEEPTKISELLATYENGEGVGK